MKQSLHFPFYSHIVVPKQVTKSWVKLKELEIITQGTADGAVKVSELLLLWTHHLGPLPSALQTNLGQSFCLPLKLCSPSSWPAASHSLGQTHFIVKALKKREDTIRRTLVFFLQPWPCSCSIWQNSSVTFPQDNELYSVRPFPREVKYLTNSCPFYPLSTNHFRIALTWSCWSSLVLVIVLITSPLQSTLMNATRLHKSSLLILLLESDTGCSSPWAGEPQFQA